MDRLDVDTWKDIVASIVYRKAVGLAVLREGGRLEHSLTHHQVGFLNENLVDTYRCTNAIE